MHLKTFVFLLALGSSAKAYSSYSSVLDSGDSRAFFAPSSQQSGSNFGVPVYNPSSSRADLLSQAEAQAAMYQQAEAQERAQILAAFQQQVEAQEQQSRAQAQQQQQQALSQEAARSNARLALYQQAEAAEQARAQSTLAQYQQAELAEQARSQILAQQQLANLYQQQVEAQPTPSTITRITVLQPVAQSFTATQDVANAQLAAAQQALLNQQYSQSQSQPISTGYGYGQQTSTAAASSSSSGGNFRFDALSPSSSSFAQAPIQPMTTFSAAPAISIPSTTTNQLYTSQSATVPTDLSGLTVSQLLSLLTGAGSSTRAQPLASSTSSVQSGNAQRQNGGYYYS